MTTMTSNRPYMLRAFYEWIVDNNCTPHLVVDAEYPATVVPTQFVSEGQIVLNVSPTATDNMLMGEDIITFNARFGGQPMQLSIPYGAVLGIYARENGAGTIFQPEDDMLPAEATETMAEEVTESVEVRESDKPKKGAHLKVVK